MTALLPDNYWTTVVAVVPVATLYACIVDYRERRVPNWLNAAILAAGLGVQAVYFGWSGVGTAMFGALVGFGMLILPWTFHGMGAGDVKLMAAIGAWFGPWLTLWGGLVGMLIGGVIAVAMILLRGSVAQSKANLGVLAVKFSSNGTAFSEFGSTKSFGTSTMLLPYGIPLTIGSLLVLFAKYAGWTVLL